MTKNQAIASHETDLPTFAKAPPVFSFQRGMLVTDGAFFNNISGQYLDHPLSVIRHGIRGTQNVNEAGDTAKAGVARDPSNIQQTETAKTEHGSDGMVVTFGLRMLDLDHALFACAAETVDITNAVRASVQGFVRRAKASLGLEEISRRIARNVANGSWLWRNRVTASTVRVEAWHGDTLVAAFDALATPTHHFDDYTADERALAEILAKGLRGDVRASIEVRAYVSFGVTGGVEVFPSQAYVENKPKGFARPLYKINLTGGRKQDDMGVAILGQAALRDQKISNRLRCMDTWYPGFDQVKRPIPVEPNGANLEFMQFFRGSRKTGSAFDMLTRLNKIDPDSEEGMFCIAILMRGGVFGEGKKSDSTTGAGSGKDKGKGKAGADEAAADAPQEA